MSFLTANGHAVAEGELSVPAVGRAIAVLRLGVAAADAAIAKGAAVTLAFEDGTTYQMTCARAGEDRGLWAGMLVGGKGKLGAALKPKFYGAGIPAATVLTDLLTEAGEEAGAVDLPGTLNFWVRREGPAYEALRALFLDFPDRAWRIGRDGKVWAGKRAWVAGPAVTLLEPRPGEGAFMLEGLPSLEPGVDLAAIGRIGRVVQRIGAKLRTEVYPDGP